MAEINWQLVKEYYTERKIKASKKYILTYKEHIKNDELIYKEYLQPPYSSEEIDKVLQEKGITIPDSLYKYLTLVSREMIVSSYPILFNLKYLPTKLEQEKVNLIYDMYNLYEDDYDDENYIPRYTSFDNNHHINEDDLNIVMTVLGDGGCSSYDYLYLGDGIYYGSVWNRVSDECLMKIENSFDNYIKTKENYI
jgi:hypothetical protein